MKRATALLPFAAAAALAASAVSAETYTVDPRHTQVLFTYSHLGFSNITGRFDNVEGTIVYDPADVAASSVEFTVPIETVSSGVKEMDAHFQRDDLFDAAQFPTATFRSTSVAAAGEGRLRVTGDLSIHGVTRPASFDVTVNKIGEHPMAKVPAAGFDAVGTIKRSDFGVDKYVPNIPDEVTIRVSTEATAKKPDATE
jgi:polyisoprenoid-binding protein YceI